MEEAWDILHAGEAKNPDLALLPSGAEFPAPPEPVAAQVRRAVLDVEQAAASEWSPLRAVRTAILSSAGMALHLEALAACDESTRQSLIRGYEANMDHLLRGAVAGASLQWLVLRCYARWKFDDAVTDDWFQNYVRVARPYIREKVRLARQHVLRVDEDARRFTEVYDRLLSELAKELLPAPPKKRFVQPDLPWE